MAVPNINQLQDAAVDSINRIQTILQRELVSVNDDVDGQPVSHPYINMAKSQVKQIQQLLIAGERYPLKTAGYRLRRNRFPFLGLAFSRYYRMTHRLVKFDDPPDYRFHTPHFARNMVFTNYNGKRGNYGGMFAQIDTRIELGRPSGPQAELVRQGGQLRLYVIDIGTARRLAIQCTNWSDTDRSLTYDLVTAAYEVLTTMTTILYRLYDLNADEIDVNDLRRHIYRFGRQISRRMILALSVEDIYKVAIVRQDYCMHGIAPQHPHDVLVVNLPDFNGIAVQPFIEADIDVQQIRDNWLAVFARIHEHMLYGRPWMYMFLRFANRDTSIRFLNIQQLGVFYHRHIQLPNNHNIDIQVQRTEIDTYRIQSPAFTGTTDNFYLAKRVPESDRWCLFRNCGYQCYLPLHSHGLSGSNQYADPDDIIDYNGNNGYQVMALEFTIALDDQSANHNQRFETTQRIYFVNREMAKELRYYFETQKVMAVYQKWFRRLLRASTRLSDAYRLLIYVNHHNDNHQLVISIRQCIRQLDTVARRLIENYEWLVKLEQIWKYSVLVPNPAAQLPMPVQTLFVNPAIYRLGRGRQVRQPDPPPFR